MSQILEFIIAALSILVTNGIFFYTINKKLKKAELKQKETEVKNQEVEILRKQDDEWQKLYYEARDRIQTIGNICQDLRIENEQLKKTNGTLELKNQQLTWYRCTVNNCPNRRPPHVFDMDGNELEAK